MDASQSIRQLIQNEVGFISVVVSRFDVESAHIERTLLFLRELIKNAPDIVRLCGNVEIVVYGYDDDDRELYEIHEVCHYFRSW